MTVTQFPGGRGPRKPAPPKTKTKKPREVDGLPAVHYEQQNLRAVDKQGYPIGKQGPHMLMWMKPSCYGVYFLIGVDPIPVPAPA